VRFEGPSILLEVIGAKVHPFMSWLTWRRSMGQQAFHDFFQIAQCNLDSLLTTLLKVVGLVEEEVGGELLVLVAGEVGLDDQITFEAKAA
jgi:hypothetical protein